MAAAPLLGGHLQEALAQYKKSKENGVERAAVHIRNVSLSLVLLSVFELMVISVLGEREDPGAADEGCREGTGK